MKKLVILLVLLGIGGYLFYFELQTTGNFLVDRETGIATKVIDGDTIVVGGEHIRLLGIDTDERGEPCYTEAKKRLEEFVLNKEIILEGDVSNKDRYKRLLRYIFVEEDEKLIHVNVALVAEGLAIARFYDDRKYYKEILAAENYARENKIGCKWANFSSD